jgi:hypothetical protein
MTEQQPRVTGRLVKMDGDWKEGEIPEHPETHPACAEIIEFTDGPEPAKVVYRRD